mgnify:CR=1 FL=1
MNRKLRALRSRLRGLSTQGRLEPDQVTVISRALERAERAAHTGNRKAMQKAVGEIAGALLSRLPFGTK